MDPRNNDQNNEESNDEVVEKTVASSSQSGAIAVRSKDSNQKLAKGEVSTFDQTDVVSEQGAQVLKEKAQEQSIKLEGQELPNFHIGRGINLLPTQTTDEIKVERKKTNVNLFSAIAILIVVFFSVIILGINVTMKVILNQEKKQLNNLESQLFSESEVIRANNDILARFDLYRNVQDATFSPKEVLLYWRRLISNFGELEQIELTNGLKFKVNGKSDSLREVAFLWHLLAIDDKVSKTTLKSFSKFETGATFNFIGDLNFDYFAQQAIKDAEDENEQNQLEEEPQDGASEGSEENL